MIELLGMAVALVGTAIVAYIDYKTGYMPDKYTHTMIALGLLFLPFYNGLSAALPYYFVAAVVFGVCFLFYIFGQLGGGDVKLFTGLALLIPVYPAALIPFAFEPVTSPYPFVLSVFFTSAVLAMFFVSLNYMVRLIRDRRKIKSFDKKVLRGVIYSAMVFPLVVLWHLINPVMTLIAIPIIAGAFVLAFKTDILKLYVVKKKKVKDLNDDDVLTLELMSASMKKKLGVGSRKTFLEMELKNLKKNARKHGVKEVLVSEYLPKFGPYILASLLLNLAVGDTLLWLLFI